MFMLDTNICIYIRRELPAQVLARLRQVPRESLCMSSVTFAELMYGARKSQAIEANIGKLNALRQHIRVLPFDEAAAETFGAIRADLERRGEIIGPYDLLIAGHALSIGATLVTNNVKEFVRVGGLPIENWTL